MHIPRFGAIYIWGFVILTGGLFSCLQSHGIYMADIDPNAWSPTDRTTLFYLNEDTLSAQDLHLVVRFCNYFEYDRLGVSITTTTPDGYHWCDTIYVDIQNQRPSSKLYAEWEQPYRTHVTLSQKGRYIFSFAPVMPNIPVRGIAAVGLKTESDIATPHPPTSLPDSIPVTR